MIKANLDTIKVNEFKFQLVNQFYNQLHLYFQLELFPTVLAVPEQIHQAFIRAFNTLSIGFKRKLVNKMSLYYCFRYAISSSEDQIRDIFLNFKSKLLYLFTIKL